MIRRHGTDRFIFATWEVRNRIYLTLQWLEMWEHYCYDWQVAKLYCFCFINEVLRLIVMRTMTTKGTDWWPLMNSYTLNPLGTAASHSGFDSVTGADCGHSQQCFRAHQTHCGGFQKHLSARLHWGNTRPLYFWWKLHQDTADRVGQEVRHYCQFSESCADYQSYITSKHTQKKKKPFNYVV